MTSRPCLLIHTLTLCSLLGCLLLGCSSADPVVYQRPSTAERAARAVFVESRPDLPRVIKQQLLSFQTTPETALRRVDYVRARPDLPQGLKQRILAGSVRLNMKAEHVRAAWGEPVQQELRGGVERWVYPSFSRRDPTRKVELFFRNGEVESIRN